GRGQHAGDRDLAAGHVDVEFVPGPGFFVALAVFLAADVAGGGQVGEHLAEVLHELPLETRRLRLRPLFVLAWTSALARRGIIGRRRVVFAVVGLVLDRLLARFDLGGVARDRPDDASGGFRSEVQPRRQHWFLNEKSGFPFRTPAFCSVSRGQRRLGEKEYRAPSVTPGVALRPRTQAGPIPSAPRGEVPERRTHGPGLHAAAAYHR